MKKLLVISLILLVSGCANYTLIEPGEHQVKDMVVSPNLAWNKTSSMLSPGKKAEMWTADGSLLNRVIFFSAIQDGDTLFKTLSKSNPQPQFKGDMLPNEVMELTESALTKQLGEGNVIVRTENLKPAMFAGEPGFRFEVIYKTSSGLSYSGNVSGTVKDNLLYMILYSATTLHYYDKYLAEVEHIFETAKLE